MKSLTALICAGVLVAAAGGALAQPPSGGNPAPAATGSPANAQDPAQLVQSVAQTLLKDLEANRETYRKNPQALREAVDRDVLRFFDIEYAARLVLGRHWRDATPEQRKRFVDAFENSMLNNYGNALVEFKGDRLKVLPSRGEPDSKFAEVRTTIRRDDGSDVPVNYVLHQTPDGWKAWDVVIQGISYVKSFRDDFGAQIDQQGIDAVIDRLQKGAKPNVPMSKPAGSKS
ncbi:MAG TPA: ABC transporter substrate-binding protein [Steroidobacteraceae bacterium]|jgi:phospholipid transport system substrate-binding protein|nr:ABC transporter substrate-binding protein [Steroidobacteraceae bacterium]